MFAHTRGDEALLNFNVDHNTYNVIGLRILDIMIIRYMRGPDEQAERYGYIQKDYRPIPEMTVQKA